MLELREHCESRGVEFRLKKVTKLVRQVLEITRLNSVFEISPDTEVVQFPLPRRSAIDLQMALCA